MTGGATGDGWSVPTPATGAPVGPAQPPSRLRTERASVAMLVLAAFLWGTTFLVVKDATEAASPVPFIATRFLIGAACLWPFARRRPGSPGELRHGVAAGLAFLAGYVFQTVGLQYTESSTSAFITYLLVVIVPLLDGCVARRWPHWSTYAGVSLAITGLALLSGGVQGLGRGELLTLAAALFFAVHLVILDRTTAKHDPVRFTLWQVLTVGAVAFLPGLALGGYGFGLPALGAAAFTGVGPTAVAVLCMSAAQRFVPPARAALLLLLEPVFAALLGYVVGERLGIAGALGATLILVAVAVTELAPAWSGRRVAARHAEV
ncbi:MAG: DMT family transporter [Actinobacteria bacterium]|nr:DMT family transporter [Actinomycetota bacterium]